jgi:DNA-binding transcriptional LysR family regulator
LAIGTTLAFANCWLVPSLESFRTAHPDIELRFVSADKELSAAGDGIDLEVKFGNGRWPRLDVVPLFKPIVFPVCSPSFLRVCGTLKSVSDLMGATLFDRENPGSFGMTWNDWLEDVGANSPAIRRQIFFSSYDVLMRAATAGQGIALGWDVLVGDLIDQRQLVCPLDLPSPANPMT